MVAASRLFSKRTLPFVKNVILFGKKSNFGRICWRGLITKTDSSYYSQQSTDPLIGLTLSQMLQNSAKEYGDRTAIISAHQKIRKKYTEFKKDADLFAAGLLAIGLRPGNLIGIWSPNSYEWLVTQYGVATAGMVLVHINAAFMVREVQYCMHKVGVHAMVVSDKFKVLDYYKMLSGIVPELPKSKAGKTKAKSLPNLTHIIMMSDKKYPGTFPFASVMKAGGKEQRKLLGKLQKKIQFDAPSNIVFTSGTTGFPKGAVLSHHCIINNAYFTGKMVGYHSKPHRICNPLPLFHVYGAVAGAVSPLLFGCCHIMPSPMFHAESVAMTVQQERCTVIYGTPTMHIDLLGLAETKKFNFSSVEYLFTGGAGCPVDIGKRLAKKIAPTLNAYGCTEVTCCVLVPDKKDSIEDQITKGGRALDHVEVKVVDLEGKIVPKGQAGELCVRGYVTMLEYFNDDEKTKEVLTKGRWYKTGDWVKMDKDGFVTIIARIKEMVIRGGENIYPKEIEDFLHTNPKVAEVQVIGVPDKRMGEEVCAWIRLKPDKKMTEDEVRRFCDGEIANYKIPRYIMFVEDFPKTATGKIQKFVMQEKAIKTLNLKKSK